jgi:hypothetical protein
MTCIPSGPVHVHGVVGSADGETRLVGLWESIVIDLECLGRGRPPTHTVSLYYIQLRRRWFSSSRTRGTKRV